MWMNAKQFLCNAHDEEEKKELLHQAPSRISNHSLGFVAYAFILISYTI